MTKKIMIVEADLPVARQLSTQLQNCGYTIKTFIDGDAALHEWNTFEPDLLLVSLELPQNKSGLSVCIDVRRISPVPIIMLSLEKDVEQKVIALDSGADDYIEKPFDMRELLARVRTLFRRADGIIPAGDETTEYTGEYVEYPGLFINQTSYTVRYDGELLTLPPKELELLYQLASSPNRVFTREQLLDHVWGYDYVGDPRTVDVHIKRIRSKIKDHETWSLSTVWGVGYKFTVTQS